MPSNWFCPTYSKQGPGTSLKQARTHQGAHYVNTDLLLVAHLGRKCTGRQWKLKNGIFLLMMIQFKALFPVSDYRQAKMEIYVTFTKRNLCPTFYRKEEGRELITFSQKQSLHKSGIFGGSIFSLSSAFNKYEICDLRHD